MVIRFSPSELAMVSEEIMARRLSGIFDDVATKLRDIVVDRVQSDVLGKIDLPTITNLTSIRAGVALGERVATATAPDAKR